MGNQENGEAVKWRTKGDGDPIGESTTHDIFAEMFAELFGRRKRGGFGGDVTYALAVGFVESCLGSKQRVTLSSGKALDVNIPPGSENGTKLRLKGQGLAGLDGAGDAIVEIAVASHPHFTRVNRDIYLDATVSLTEVLLGANIKVSTLDGTTMVKVPKGVSTGTLLRLRGKGLPPYGRNPAGDFYVRFRVTLPDPPDHGLTELIEKWGRKQIPIGINMGKQRRQILIVIAAVMLGMLLFPPSHVVGSSITGAVEAVDKEMLRIQLFVTLVVGAIAFVICSDRKE
ncbi:MAG: DnaJ C-terminal domain-containing protein [Alphaproteobacteria bacterium]